MQDSIIFKTVSQREKIIEHKYLFLLTCFITDNEIFEFVT